MNHDSWVFNTSMALASMMGMVRAAPNGRRNGGSVAFPKSSGEPPLSVTRGQPRQKSFLSLGPHGFHRLAYNEWGDPANTHVVVCVHGFTRNSRDFDVLASKLAERCRVVCVDVVGRGASDWLAHKDDYDYSLYLSDAAALLGHIMATGKEPATTYTIDWVGTSMGGLIGMLLAAKSNAPIRRLVLNDVGPLVPWAALSRLRSMHIPFDARFKSLDHVETHLRRIFASFGPLHDEGWQHVARHSAYVTERGEYMLSYDPGIMSSMNHARNGIEFGPDFLSGVDLWPSWDRVRSPTLVLRGLESDVLPSGIAREMLRRGPETRIVELSGIGHAPWLMNDEQTGIVQEFLLTP